MTTSPPSQAVPQISQQKQVLSAERAASIGWFFIESYYDFYNKNVENIHKLYHSKASLCHGGFPEENGDEKVLRKASGTEAIKNRFQNDDSLKNSNTNAIVVTSADIQICLDDMILIVVFGEWSKQKSPFYQFSQTFLLCPGKKENTYDLANDNLRFVDYKEFGVAAPPPVVDECSGKTPPPETQTKSTQIAKQPATPVKQAASASVVAKNAVSVSRTDKEKPAEKPAEQLAKQPETEPQPKAAVVSKEMAKETPKTKSDPEQDQLQKKEKSPIAQNGVKEQMNGGETAAEAHAVAPSVSSSPESGAKPGHEDEELDSKESSHEAEENAETVKPAASKPLSWAALAAQQPPPPPPAAVATSKSAGAATTKVASASPKTAPQKPVAQQASQATQPNNVKYKKEDWFPIYIRGVKDINEDSLKTHLTKKFGEIKFFRVFLNIALCDFLEGEAQKRALEAKETEVDGYVIQLEVRESKNNKNNAKNQKEKTADKRGKNDKKQPGKKNKPNAKNID